MQTASWTDWLEARLGHWAIPNIIRTFIVLTTLVYVLSLISPTFTTALFLSPYAVLQGEAWRLFTFMFISGEKSILWFLLYLYFLWWVGQALELDWGAFKVNLYFFLGMVSLWCAAFLFPHTLVTPMFFISSLIVAFGTAFPNEQIFIFPLPIAIKSKYIAMFSAALSIFAGWGMWALLIASFLPYILFFLPSFIQAKRSETDARKRMARFRGDDKD